MKNKKSKVSIKNSEVSIFMDGMMIGALIVVLVILLVVGNSILSNSWSMFEPLYMMI